MSKEKTYKVLARLAWVLTACGIIFLVNSAMHSGAKEKCQGIQLSDAGKTVDSAKRAEIFNIIRAYVNNSVTQMTVHDIPLTKLEEVLDNEEWIDGAHVYFDNANYLHIDLNSRKPVARIFSDKGGNYYLDASAREFTVFNIKQNDLVLFTGVPTPGRKDSANKAVLQSELVTIAQAIATDSFWLAQTDQVEYTPAGYKLHPVLGNHTVWLGNSHEMNAKLARLKIFYKQVLSQVGLDAFGVINVAYAGQVVVQQSMQTQKVSAVQLNRNMEKMADKNKTIADETAIPSAAKAGRLVDTKPVAAIEEPAKETVKPQAKTPKAIMPKKINNNN